MFTGRSDPTDAHIRTGTGIKTENFHDSPSSSKEPPVSNAVMFDWDMVLGDQANPFAESSGRSCGSPSHGDQVTDLSNIDESPVQPVLQNFPVSMISGKPRRFTAHWYNKYSAWLEYNAEKDAILCKMCRHFGNDMVSDQFSGGFRNWKRIHRACLKSSKAHNTALCRYKKYKACPWHTSRASLQNQLNHQTLTPGVIQNNRDHIKVILDIVMFCVKQHIAPCKHKENDLGSFHELFQLLCKHDPRIKSRFDAIPKNKTSTERPHRRRSLSAASTNKTGITRR